MAKALGRRYAKALLELYPHSELEGVDKSLRAVALIWSESAELRRAILNPAFRVEERTQALSAVFSKVRPHDVNFANIASLLVENGRAKWIPDIAEAFSAMVAEIRKVLTLKISSARQVDDSERSSLEASIAKQFGSLASISWNTDAELIGGLVVRAGDKMLDGSVRGSLNRVRQQLIG